jgi:hypothetical protein
MTVLHRALGKPFCAQRRDKQIYGRRGLYRKELYLFLITFVKVIFSVRRLESCSASESTYGVDTRHPFITVMHTPLQAGEVKLVISATNLMAGSGL